MAEMNRVSEDDTEKRVSVIDIELQERTSSSSSCFVEMEKGAQSPAEGVANNQANQRYLVS